MGGYLGMHGVPFGCDGVGVLELLYLASVYCGSLTVPFDPAVIHVMVQK